MFVGNLITGAIVTETVFAWPGIGRLTYEAVIYRDFPLLQAVIIPEGDPDSSSISASISSTPTSIRGSALRKRIFIFPASCWEVSIFGDGGVMSLSGSAPPDGP